MQPHGGFAVGFLKPTIIGNVFLGFNKMNKQKGITDMGVKFDRLVYGGDYNPDQWLEYPNILEEDIRLMKKAHVNTVSLGIFCMGKIGAAGGCV